MLLRRFLTKQNITLGYGYNKYLILIFSVFLLSSILVGFFARGPTFLVMVRVQMILLLFLIFMNLYDTKYLMTKIIKILYYTGLINVFIAFCAFFQIELWRLTIYPDFISYMKYMWFGLYVSIFSYAILLNKIFIKRKSSMLDYALLIMIVIVVLINITNKPIFLAAFIVTFTTLLVFFNARIKRVKIGIISLLVLLSPMFLYLGLDEEKKFLFVYVVSERFLKAPAYDLTDLVENLTTMESSGGRDFSAGRLELWQWYLSNVLDTPIVSDNFGARPSIPLSSVGDEEVEFAAHNSVVHYTYYAGYIAGVSLLLIILYFNLAGCAKLSEDIRISKDSKGLIKIGMTEAQVTEIVGRGVSSQDYYHVNTTEYEKHTIWKTRSSLLSDSITNYTFEFRNGKLTDWSKSGSK